MFGQAVLCCGRQEGCWLEGRVLQARGKRLLGVKTEAVLMQAGSICCAV